jgi:hypothetical protein
MSSSNSTIANGLTETIRPTSNGYADSMYGFSNKTIIVILALLIIMILLNNDIRIILENLVRTIYNLVSNILRLLGIITGSTINVTANIGANVARTGINIAEGTLQSVGNILAGGNAILAKDLDATLNGTTIQQQNTIPAPDNTANPIQKPIVENKQAWCLVGEYKGTRSCVEVSQADKCMSGQVYPQQKMCLNPALTKNT